MIPGHLRFKEKCYDKKMKEGNHPNMCVEYKTVNFWGLFISTCTLFFLIEK